MNERIKELELEATVYADSKVPVAHRYNDIYYKIVCGKLAELLVRECINQCNQVTVEYDEYQGIDGELAARAIGAYNCSDRIADYFGVEE